MPPIIQKCLWFDQLLPPLAPNILVSPIFLTSLCQRYTSTYRVHWLTYMNKLHHRSRGFKLWPNKTKERKSAIFSKAIKLWRVGYLSDISVMTSPFLLYLATADTSQLDNLQIHRLNFSQKISLNLMKSFEFNKTQNCYASSNQSIRCS